MERFPDINSLANAEEDEVLSYWSGLGYYSRGRNLLKSAKILQKEFSSVMPDTSEQLQLLPGIGKSLLGKKDAFKGLDKKQAERYKNPKGIERVATGIADKITGDKFDFDMRGKSKDKKTDIKSSYEYDAYDLVLEYLLSSEQAATIEEANYVMTEMDAETIQGIVEAQKKTLMKEQG